MFFRNLTMFTFAHAGLDHWFDMSVHAEEVERDLGACALKPVGPLELASQGFVPPYGADDGRLAVRHGDCILLAIGSETKILPDAAINDRLAKGLAAVEKAEGRKMGGRFRKRMREDLIHDMLPKALVKPGRVQCYIDLQRHLLVVDTAIRKQAESVVSEIRRALGSFLALPLNAEKLPRVTMTHWIGGTSMPDGFSLGDECELRDTADHGAVIKCQHQELRGEEIATHLEMGKQVTRLALDFHDLAGFVLGEDLVLRKFWLHEGAVDRLESIEREDIPAELDARFVLMTETLGELFDALFPALSVSKAGVE